MSRGRCDDGSVNRLEISAAADRIQPYLRRTPVIELEPGLLGTPGSVAAKLELIQHTGSFKPRGAFNRMLKLEIPEAGVIAASGGNHGQAVAYAARALGVPSEIFVPEVAPDIKVQKLHEFGATVNVIPGIYDNAYAKCAQRQGETGAPMVHAFNDPEVLAGQGTMTKEITEQVPDVDTILIASGGGGLGAGAAAWLGPDGPRLVIVEPASSCCYSAAKHAGEPVPVTAAGVAVDSLGAGTVGELAFDLLMSVDAQSVLVDDANIVEAQQLLWDRLRLIVEPGGATAAAALLAKAYVPDPDERVVVVICGSNCDPASVSESSEGSV